MTNPGLEPFEFYCCAAHVRNALCRKRHGQAQPRPLNGPQLASGRGALLHPHDRAHVMTGFERFSQYHVALVEAFKQQTERVQ